MTSDDQHQRRSEVLDKAIEVFGSLGEARQWLYRPAPSLNQHRPIDLLATPDGGQQVWDYLGRIEHGVYT